MAAPNTHTHTQTHSERGRPFHSLTSRLPLCAAHLSRRAQRAAVRAFAWLIYFTNLDSLIANKTDEGLKSKDMFWPVGGELNERIHFNGSQSEPKSKIIWKVIKITTGQPQKQQKIQNERISRTRCRFKLALICVPLYLTLSPVFRSSECVLI